MASSEWPPSSKKLSWTPTRSPPEQLGPDPGQRLLDRARGAARSRPLGRRRGRPGSGRALRSTLPLGVSGSASSDHERRGDHVLGQRLLEPSAQLGGVGRTGPSRGDDVGDQAPARPVASSRATTTASRTAGCRAGAASISPSSIRKPRILTWWSTRPEALERAVGPPAGEVAGPVEPAARASAERVGDEPLGRQAGPVQVAARQRRRRRCTARRHADRDRPQPRVEHVELRVGDRPADRDRPVAGLDPRRPTTRSSSRSARRGSRAAAPCRAADRPGRGAAPRRRRASSAPACPRQPASSSSRQVAGVAWRNVIARVVEPLGEPGAVGGHVAADQLDPRADDQRQEELQRGDVERERRDGQQRVARRSSRAAPRIDARKLASAPCVTCTPLGRPVEPEV